MSPSSRRAWIEMILRTVNAINDVVALLAEGVDRNNAVSDGLHILHKSPSSRRAWIEMRSVQEAQIWEVVALLAEGVDRNSIMRIAPPVGVSRPPRGGRG